MVCVSLKTHIFYYLLDISTWVCNRHLKLHVSNTALLVFPQNPPTCFLISFNDTFFILLVDQVRNLGSSLVVSFTLHVWSFRKSYHLPLPSKYLTFDNIPWTPSLPLTWPKQLPSFTWMVTLASQVVFSPLPVPHGARAILWRRRLRSFSPLLRAVQRLLFSLRVKTVFSKIPQAHPALMLLPSWPHVASILSLILSSPALRLLFWPLNTPGVILPQDTCPR